MAPWGQVTSSICVSWEIREHQPLITWSLSQNKQLIRYHQASSYTNYWTSCSQSWLLKIDQSSLSNDVYLKFLPQFDERVLLAWHVAYVIHISTEWSSSVMIDNITENVTKQSGSQTLNHWVQEATIRPNHIHSHTHPSLSHEYCVNIYLCVFWNDDSLLARLSHFVHAGKERFLVSLSYSWI